MDPNAISEQRLTAYALGEVEDEAERRAIEQRLEQDPDAAAHVEQVQRLGRDLSETFDSASEEGLSSEHRARIRAARKRGPFLRRAGKPLAAAAALLLVAGAGAYLMLPDLGAARRIVRVDRDMSETRSLDASAQDGAKGRAGERPASHGTGEAGKEAEKRQAGGGDASGTAAQQPAAAQSAEQDALSVEQTRKTEKTESSTEAEDGRNAPSFMDAAAAPEKPEERSRKAVRDAPEDGASGRQLSGGDNRNFNTEQYDEIRDNPFRRAAERPLSTFSVDVDNASYTQVRRFLLRENRLPPRNAVRIEEMINYFDYGYEPPAGDPAEGDAPFAARTEVAAAPWQPSHRLVRIGLKGWKPRAGRRKPANLVFLIDVSGSMRSKRKLGLLKDAFHKLAAQLDERDRVSMVVYAGSSGVALEPTSGSETEKIQQAVQNLRAGGSTAGAAGIRLAYRKAQESFREDAVNRVILATDGDFNVGVTDRGALRRLIQEKAKSGVTVSVLGVGTGNIKDDRMERLSNKGNGNYYYLDSAEEAERVLVERLTSTLQTIAKDVKVQVEFNPAEVASYRLIGYANRILDKEDFNDDTKDAGDIGAGHDVTAFYEVVPAEAAGEATTRPKVDALKYQKTEKLSEAARSGELMTLKLRYKAPSAAKKQGTSELLRFPVEDEGRSFGEASADFRFGASVAAFGMLLRDSEHQGKASYGAALEWARGALVPDVSEQRAELLEMIRKARDMASEGGEGAGKAP